MIFRPVCLLCNDGIVEQWNNGYMGSDQGRIVHHGRKHSPSQCSIFVCSNEDKEQVC